MQVEVPRANPFVLMMAPQQVLEAMKQSDELRRLQYQVFHPLDTRAGQQANPELAAYDAAIDRIQLALPAEREEA
jgi:hypothetical protein